MEYLALFDKNNNVLDEKFLRGDGKIPHGKYAKVSIIWIENSNGEYLIQKTSPQKNSKLSLTGGHCKYGDDEWKTIITEVKEELGVELIKKDISHLATLREGHRFIEVFYTKQDLDIKQLVLQEEEVESVFWCSKRKIKSIIEKEKLVQQYGSSFMERVLPDNLKDKEEDIIRVRVR